MFKIEDEATGWVGLDEGLAGAPVSALQVDPSSSRIVYAGSFGDGLFKSSDGGTWAPLNDGLTGDLLQALVIHPRTPSTLYAGSFGDGIFKSTDAGSTWTDVNSGLTGFPRIRALAIDASSPDTLYAATGSVCKSTDGGRLWVRIGYEWTQKGVSIQPQVWSLALAPSALYAGTSSGVFKMVQNPAR